MPNRAGGAMTRRELFGLLCALPLFGLPLRGLAKARPAAVVLAWDWDPGTGGPIDYFEVVVTSGESLANESNSIITRVGGDLRSSEISLLGDGPHLYQARVRAVNALGSSAL